MFTIIWWLYYRSIEHFWIVINRKNPLNVTMYLSLISNTDVLFEKWLLVSLLILFIWNLSYEFKSFIEHKILSVK
jgi:hypothetical protein